MTQVLLKNIVHFNKHTSLWQEKLKNPNGIQIFLAYEKETWGTYGSPGSIQWRLTEIFTKQGSKIAHLANQIYLFRLILYI
jgi:hypothetical protein